MKIDGCKFGEVNGNHFSSVENEGAGESISIGISDSYYVNVTNNFIDGANVNDWGISLVSSDYCIISNNNIRRCKTYGIYDNGDDYHTINGNSITGCGTGIYITANCDYSIVTSNQLHGNSTSFTDFGSNTVKANNQET
jgi:nitrous oxidase accessory protein NosD